MESEDTRERESENVHDLSEISFGRGEHGVEGSKGNDVGATLGWISVVDGLDGSGT